MKRNIFIVGVGRSGTSLLQSMMSSHPSIFFLSETSIVREYVLNNKTKINSWKNLIKEYPRFNRVSANLNYSDVSMKLNKLDLYNSLFPSDDNYLFFGDKDPRLIECLTELNKEFPSSKILLIYRDPRDVMLSKSKAKWSRKKGFLLNIFITLFQFYKGQNSIKKFNKIHEVCYEELIFNPEHELKKICDEIGLEFDYKMISFQSEARKLVSRDEIEWKQKTFEPIDPNNSNKWSKEFSLVKIAFMDSIFCDYLNYYAYSSFRPLTTSQRFFYIAIFSVSYPLSFVIRNSIKLKLMIS